MGNIPLLEKEGCPLAGFLTKQLLELQLHLVTLPVVRKKLFVKI